MGLRHLRHRYTSGEPTPFHPVCLELSQGEESWLDAKAREQPYNVAVHQALCCGIRPGRTTIDISWAGPVPSAFQLVSTSSQWLEISNDLLHDHLRGLLLIAFGVWERFYAPKKFIPWELLTDRTVFGAFVLSAVLFVSFYLWDAYFYSFLQVVNNQSVTQASYIFNIYSIGACFWAIPTGMYIRYTGRFKNIALFFGIPLTILGVALMIHFRRPDQNIGSIVMCQIFIAVSGGTLVICEQLAAMAAASHQHVAVVIAIEGMFSSVGGAIGSTIASAIWQGVFPVKLAEYLPAESQGDLLKIYGDLVTQLSYPVGSPTRDAINRAYGDTQKLMVIASTAFLSLGIVGVLMWRNINVKDFKQVKGRVA